MQVYACYTIIILQGYERCWRSMYSSKCAVFLNIVSEQYHKPWSYQSMSGSYMLCIMRHRVKFQKRSVYFGLMRVLKGPLVCQRVSSFRQHETETCTNPRQGNEQRPDTLPCRAPNRIQIFPSPALFCSFMLEKARCVALCSNRRRFLIYVPMLIAQ